MSAKVATTPPRCFKAACPELPKHSVSPMQSVTIKCCERHLADAKHLAQTGTRSS